MIGTLRVRGLGRDSPALRLAVSNRLSSAELRPPGLAPSAVLIVRQLHDPLPGRITAQPGIPRPDSVWERAVQGRLEQLLRSAVRPQRGVVAGTANAVLFNDEAEMMACLALDLAKGAAWQRWWWKLIMKSISLSDASITIKKIFCDNAVFIPSVIDYLSRWQQSENTLQALSPADSLDVLRIMLDVNGLSEIKTGLNEVLFGQPAVTTMNKRNVFGQYGNHPYEYGLSDGTSEVIEKHHKRQTHDTEHKTPVYAGIHSDGTSPWSKYLPSVSNSRVLGKEQFLLLGLGLSLYRMPWLARRSDFQRDLIYWWKDTRDYSYKKTVPESSAGIGQTAGAPCRDSTDNTLESVSEVVRDSGRRKIDKHDGGFINEEIRTKEQTDEQTGCEQISIRNDVNSSDLLMSDKDRSVTEENTLTSDFIYTRMGGVLYLINLMKQLKLPQCFENDWKLAGQMGMWGLLELLGRALLDNRMDEFRDDQLWSALAKLDGREAGNQPGERFTGNADYKLPHFWFEQVYQKPEIFYWAVCGRRLRLWSSMGYLLVEVARDENRPYQQAADELKDYPGVEHNHMLLRSAFAKAPVAKQEYCRTLTPAGDLAGWLVAVVPFIEYYLHLLLDFSGTEDDLTGHVLACPGRLYVTSSHVDFVAGLDNISISARMAGLDSDPGWLPEFGRVVQFHFD